MAVMPITSSAKKALRSSNRKRVQNLSRKKEVLSVIKKVRKLIQDKKYDEAEALLPQVQKALDKATKTGIIKKNNASRKKSRISKLIKKSRN